MGARRVAVIGLGKMGGPMALHLHDRGLLAAVYSPRTAKSFVANQGLADAVRLAPSPKEAVRAADTVVVSVPRPAVDGVLFGGNGIAEGMKSGVVIESGNSDHRRDAAYESQFAANGVGYLDAPVSGGPRRARAGELVSIVGGRRETFEDARPVFESFSRRDAIFYVGPSGRGHEAKMYHNQDEQNDMRNIGEAISLLVASGLGSQDALTALDRGACRSALLSHAGTVPPEVLPRIAPRVGGGDLPEIAIATADAIPHAAPLTRMTLNLRRLSRRELGTAEASTRAAADFRAGGHEDVVRLYNLLRERVPLDDVPEGGDVGTVARVLALGYVRDLAEVVSIARRQKLDVAVLTRILRAGLCDKAALDGLLAGNLDEANAFEPTLSEEDHAVFEAGLSLGERLGHPTPSAAAYMDGGDGRLVARELRKLSQAVYRRPYDNAFRIQAGIRNAFGEHGYETQEVSA